ncbi:MAG: PIG-L family deacetylase [Clostridia bacterium]|nr:PIG-L family deacetylase [Clostridia bacterium]
MMRNRFLVLLLFLLLGVLLLSAASAGEAEDISSRCKFKIDSHALKATRLVDGTYTKYWYSGEMKNPYLGISSPEPMYGLYLCFREMPDSYVIQRRENDEWVDLLEGDTRFYHVFYELSGETDIRILSTQQKKHRLMLNELFVFGSGDVPDWVQRWNDTEEKADILFLVAHPDDELIFLAGAIPTYDVELEKRVVVAYLTFANKTRRSEALNGLWTMGVRNYPVFGPFPDKYSRTLKEAYRETGGGGLNAGTKKVLGWITGLFRQYRPEVVVTQDIRGEYGHGQHRLIADGCIQGFDLAADAAQYPESAEQYGAWEVKKLYVHLYGDSEKQIHFDWDVPLSKLDGKTGMELACEAFTKHVTQADLKFTIGGKRKPLAPDITGVYYSNTDFGLHSTRVGEDEARNDFLEHITGQE